MDNTIHVINISAQEFDVPLTVYKVEKDTQTKLNQPFTFCKGEVYLLEVPDEIIDGDKIYSLEQFNIQHNFYSPISYNKNNVIITRIEQIPILTAKYKDVTVTFKVTARNNRPCTVLEVQDLSGNIVNKPYKIGEQYKIWMSTDSYLGKETNPNGGKIEFLQSINIDNNIYYSEVIEYTPQKNIININSNIEYIYLSPLAYKYFYDDVNHTNFTKDSWIVKSNPFTAIILGKARVNEYYNNGQFFEKGLFDITPQNGYFYEMNERGVGMIISNKTQKNIINVNSNDVLELSNIEKESKLFRFNSNVLQKSALENYFIDISTDMLTNAERNAFEQLSSLRYTFRRGTPLKLFNNASKFLNCFMWKSIPGTNSNVLFFSNNPMMLKDFSVNHITDYPERYDITFSVVDKMMTQKYIQDNSVTKYTNVDNTIPYNYELSEYLMPIQIGDYFGYNTGLVPITNENQRIYQPDGGVHYHNDTHINTGYAMTNSLATTVGSPSQFYPTVNGETHTTNQGAILHNLYKIVPNISKDSPSSHLANTTWNANINSITTPLDNYYYGGYIINGITFTDGVIDNLQDKLFTNSSGLIVDINKDGTFTFQNVNENDGSVNNVVICIYNPLIDNYNNVTRY